MVQSPESLFTAEWNRLAGDLQLSGPDRRAIGEDLLNRHLEVHRRYHTVDHINAVLDHLVALGACSPTTRLAAFFHDAIYEPARADNERRSAELAKRLLTSSCRAASALADDVFAIVVSTERHELPDDAPVGTASFLDADLAILGADRSTYANYATAIAHEYRHLTDAEFRSGRRQVLGTLLDRPTLYFTELGRSRWESAARANLAREIDQLRSN